jgi:ATP-binding cassette, subfamily B, bacterial PglK
MFRIFKNCFSLISKKQKKNTILILIGNQIGSILEVIGLGIIPILAINLLDKNKLIIFLEKKNLSFLTGLLEFENFVFYSFLFLVFFFIFKNFYLIGINYLQTKLRIDIFNTISNNFFQLYIYSPYKYFLKKNPTYLSSIMTNEVHGACTVLEIFVLLLKDFFTVFVICITLILIDPIISGLLILFIVIFTLVFYGIFKKFLFIRGKLMQEARADNLKIIHQSFDIIREAKILKKEKFFSDLFDSQLNLMAEQKITSSVINMIPRPFLEIFTLVVITLIIFYSTFYANSLDTALPFIAFFAVSSIRLIPAFKGISNSLASINFNKISVDVVIEELNELKNNKLSFSSKENLNKNLIHENFNTFEVKDLNFSYDNNIKVLKNINFKVRRGEKIGIVGHSGSGKSTLINIILGLLKPTSGNVLIDNQNIYEALNEWYNLLGYIPQDIYLLNDTIKNNIALGENDENIRLHSIEKALSMSNSKKFVEKLSKNIETNVGNRGISISGGQKQRIGIARAFYRNSKILILDEATNSLDQENEKEIINQIISLNDITVFIIAHNINALKKCDKILYLDQGKLLDFDSFEKITEKYKLIS